MTLCSGVVIIIGASLGQAFSNSEVSFIITRELKGFSAGLMTQTVVLVSELSYPTYRAFFSCFYMTMYYVGSFLVLGYLMDPETWVAGHGD